MGSYGLTNWVTLNNGNGVSIRLDGVIYRLGTAGGNMIAVENTNDFEFYSGNSKGAIQGYGYTFHTSCKSAVTTRRNQVLTCLTIFSTAGSYG